MALTRTPKDYVNKIQRSSHDLTTERRTTAHIGTLIPIYFRRVLGAGDNFKIKPQTLLQSKSMIGPLMGKYKVRLEYVFEPLRNLYGWLDNNSSLSTEELLNRKKHTFVLNYHSQAAPNMGEDDFGISLNRNESLVGYGSLLHYCGLPAGFTGLYAAVGDSSSASEFSMEYILTYIDYWRCYHQNRQEKDIPYISSMENLSNAPFATFGDSNAFDNIFKVLRYQDDGLTLDVEGKYFDGHFGEEYPHFVESAEVLGEFISASSKDYCGLLPVKYESDIYHNLLNIDDTNVVKSRVTVSGNGSNAGFNIEELRFANQLQRTIDRLDVSGGRFSNWMRTLWGVKTVKGLDIPQLLGVSSNVIDPQNITSTAKTGIGDDTTEVGQMQARSDQYNKNYQFHSFNFQEPGIFMVCASIIPIVDYSQGVDWQLTNTRFFDDYSPEFARKGFDDVPRYLYSGLLDGVGVFEDGIVQVAGGVLGDQYLDEVVGRNVSWIHEMSDVNRCFGEFAYGGYDEYMVLHRDFTKVSGDLSQDGRQFFELTTYINPLDFQSNFAGTGISQPNWWLQVGFDITANRPIGGRWMPALE